jgi:hypothetical protein
MKKVIRLVKDYSAWKYVCTYWSLSGKQAWIKHSMQFSQTYCKRKRIIWRNTPGILILERVFVRAYRANWQMKDAVTS